MDSELLRCLKQIMHSATESRIGGYHVGVAGPRILHQVGQLGNCGDVYIYLPWCLDAEGYDGGHS